MALTKVTGQVIKSDTNITSHNINSSGIITAVSFSGPLDTTGGNFTGVITATSATFSGNVTIGGTLTYEDVTNIDSLGIVTARNGLRVTAGGANIDQLNVSGVSTITKGTSGGATANTDAALIVDNSSHTYVQFRTPATKEQGLLFGDDADNDAGAITYNHSTNSLGFRVNANERARIDSSGRIGLGITNPGDYFSSYNRVVMGRTNDTGGMTIVSGTGSGGYIIFADGTSGNTAYRGSIAYQHNGDYMTFGTDGGNERLRITSAGKVGINSTSPADLLTIGAAANTLAFGCKDTTRNNHVWQLLNNDNSGNAEFRMYKNSVSGTHAQSINFATSGDANYILDGNFGIGINNPNAKFQVEGASAYALTSSGRATEGIDVNATAGGSGNYGSGISFGAGATGRAAIVSLQGAADADNVGLAVITHPVGTGSADGVEKLRITSGGKVGINTYASAAWLNIHQGDSGTVDAIIITNTSTTNNGLSLGVSSVEDAFFWNGSNTNMTFATANEERLRIDSAGRVQIGHTGSIVGGRVELHRADAETWMTINESSDSGSGPALYINRTRGSNLTNPSPVANGNWLGNIHFGSYDTNSYEIGASISAAADGQTWADGDCPARLMFYTTPDGSTTPAERIRITSDGRIGINDTSPNDYEMDICKRSAATDAQVRIYNDATGSSNDSILRLQIAGTGASNYIYFGDGDDANAGMMRYYHNDDSLRITCGAKERFRIHDGGGFRLWRSSEAYEAVDILHTADYGNGTMVLKPVTQPGSGVATQYIYLKNNGSGSGSTSMNLVVDGSITGGSKNFRIPHPLTSLKDTKQLVHASIEGPSYDLIYRGKVTLSSGTATVNIDTVSNMTAGTFVALNRDIQCFTSNETGWDAVKGSVSGNILTITSQNNSSTDTISWMVVGERQDPSIKESPLTDDDGYLIVEADKGGS